MLDCEFIVVDGPYVNASSGSTWSWPAPLTAMRRPRKLARQAANDLGVRPRNQARRHESGGAQARTVELGDFDDMRFIAKIGVEKGKPEKRRQRRELPRQTRSRRSSPRTKDWHAVEQPPRLEGQIAGDAGACGANRQAGLGVMKSTDRHPAASAIEDAWQRRATAAAIEAARGVVKVDGPIPPGTPIGRLGDIEWGWIVAAILFGWISTRAEQATAEKLDTEQTIRMTGSTPSRGMPARSRRSCRSWRRRPISTGRSRSPLVARHHDRVPAHGHAAGPQGHDRTRPQ